VLPIGKQKSEKAVDICFADEEIQHLYCCRGKLVQKFGAELTRKICCRLSILAAAPCLADVPTSPPIHLAAMDGKGTFSVALDPAHRLQFSAPAGSGRAHDLSKVVTVLITGLISVPIAKGKAK